MDQKKYFFRLNAAQAVILVGIVELISVLQVLFGFGLVFSYASVDNVDSPHFNWGFLLLPSTFISGLRLLFPSLLIIGVLKDNTRFVLSWIIVNWIWIRVAFCAFLYFPTNVIKFSGVSLFFYASFVTVGFVFNIYSQGVVQEYYNQCKCKKQELFTVQC
ncbi:uncharacterized protein LOC132204465 isoform X2 [Neocloeon triangulifer]|uniref:uncharacterized protein LOC132204465 isoform X2 n=1 Tax=Neocloeon triangulifer TaxID=2078957 RepID=UPI00286EEED9|nr:uncharacterized protein LOC132204465 isoform X2 [Neocloeon triangulifer]